jgi:predicted ATPase/class 3 adenylate cyclase
MLFSDVEGSTAVLSRLGGRYAAAVDSMRSALRSAWRAHDGVEMGTEGDSFFVVFFLASQAVGAALDAQRGLAAQKWPEGDALRVRVGVHTGEPLRHADGYVGMDVHRAARVSAAAHGGQVLVTAPAWELARTAMPTAAARDLGSHRLRDLDEPMHLFQVSAAGLPDAFPPPRSLGTLSNLPSVPTELVGRDSEVAEASALIDGGARLVTLTGPAGSGKTRVAVALAQARAAKTPDGVYFVPLAAVTDAAEIWPALAAALSLPGGGDPRQRLVAQVAGRAPLIILDNLEQIATVGDIVHDLLAELPSAVVVATSRRALHVVGEYERPVEPLAVPDQGSSLSEVETSQAVELFTLRAKMVRPDFEVTADNAADVVGICRRVDGLPLGVELAAGRLRLLSPRSVLEGIASSLDLRDAAAGRPSRQQVLRDAVAWSYDLLDSPQQAALRCLGVLAGGDLSACAAVAGLPSEAAALDAVAGLADVSLVRLVEGPHGQPRLELLQTIADFAVERLAESDEEEAVRSRHAEYFTALAEQQRPSLFGGDQARAAATLALERDNFRAALTWCLSPNGPRPTPERARLGLRLCASLRTFWIRWPHDMRDSTPWYQRALELGPPDDSVERAQVMQALAIDDSWQGRSERGRARASEAAEMCRRLGDAQIEAGALTLLGAFTAGDKDYAAALGLLADAERLARSVDASEILSITLLVRAECETAVGHHDSAADLYRECADLAAQRGDERELVNVSVSLADHLGAAGRSQDGLDELERVRPAVLRIGSQTVAASALDTYASLFAAVGDHEAAAIMTGSLWALTERLGGVFDLTEEELWTRPNGVAVAHDTLGDDRWTQLVARGQGMSVDGALEYARARAASDA